MKTKFLVDEIGRVIITFENLYDDGKTVERIFSCPVDGGYVRELYPNGEWKQVCDRLGDRGSTLMCSSRGKLLDVVRREFNAMLRKQKRDLGTA